MKEFKAGTYYVGDLCYILSDVWDEVCDHFDDGVFTLIDGRKCAMHSTMHGDGRYTDQDGDTYAVDSGTIGCVMVEGHEVGQFENGNAMIIEFLEDFDTDSSEGVISIGNIEIDTDD